jgi:hypothetical protein
VDHLDSGRRDVHDVELSGERLDNAADVVEPAGEDLLAERFAHPVEAARVEVRRCRDLRDRDLLFGEGLDVAELPLLARLGERDRDPARPTRPVRPTRWR